MLLQALFTSPNDAIAAANMEPGDMGGRPSIVRLNQYSAGVEVRVLQLFDDLATWQAHANGEDRKRALAKLTPEEKRLLNLTD